jgi:CAAX amino terminal protease family.
LVCYAAFTGSVIYLVSVRPPGFQLWLATVSLGQLVIGVLLAWRCKLEGVIASRRSWGFALLLLAVLQVAEYVVAVHRLPLRLDLVVVAKEFLRYVIMIGLAEELWFRGLWFKVWANRTWPSVVGGSVLFGLYHAAAGWNAIVTTAAVGFVFAVARRAGASLLMLAVVHGMMDLMNRFVLPGVSWRFPQTVATLVFALLCVVGGIALQRGSRRKIEASGRRILQFRRQ